MATQQELADLVMRFINDPLDDSIVRELVEPLSQEERRLVLSLLKYEVGRQIKRVAQRRAFRLLRSMLTRQQRAQLKWTGWFEVVGTAGGRYRLMPRIGRTERMCRHGKYDYWVASYCLHDQGSELPNADITIAHLLMLVTDEPAFLAAANEHLRDSDMWSGEWRRRLASARRRLTQEAA